MLIQNWLNVVKNLDNIREMVYKLMIERCRFWRVLTNKKESIRGGNTMNKTELVAAMAKETNLSKKDVEDVLKSFVDVVSKELKNGGKIQLVGFGTFEVSERAAREGRNPQTGETMKIEASKAPKFKAGKALKDMVNGK